MLLRALGSLMWNLLYIELVICRVLTLPANIFGSSWQVSVPSTCVFLLSVQKLGGTLLVLKNTFAFNTLML